LRPGTSEVLALVGSVDFNDESIDGQVNMALSPRQPGSSIKPILFATAFSDNLISPASIRTMIAALARPGRRRP